MSNLKESCMKRKSDPGHKIVFPVFGQGLITIMEARGECRYKREFVNLRLFEILSLILGEKKMDVRPHLC